MEAIRRIIAERDSRVRMSGNDASEEAVGKRHRAALVVLPRQPRLDCLLMVVPIAQAREASGITVLALSLETYTAGFVVTFQAQSHGAVPFIDERPTLTLTVTDDRERQYQVLLCGVTGEGVRNDWQWRLTYRCFPVLAPDAAVLRLMIATMVWQLPNPTRHASVPVSTVEGPWAFALPLPPTGDIASASP